MPTPSSDADTGGAGYEVRWRSHNAERRQLILDTALDLLEATPAGVEPTVQDIARRAGLSKSVVYRQFANRDDLYCRMRTHLTDNFARTLDAELDLTSGSAADVLTRTIAAVAGFMAAHPRWIDLARNGPRHDDPVDVDALTSLKRRMSYRAKELLDAIAVSAGVDPAAFGSITFAVVAMVEGALDGALSDPAQDRPLADVVSELSNYTWYMLDGVARAHGLDVDPAVEVTDVVSRLVEQAATRSQST